MIESIRLLNNIPVRNLWKRLPSYVGLSPIVQVYGICFTDNKEVVVIRHPLDGGDGFNPWNLPGGTPENGETPEMTLIREVDEEADISIDKIAFLGANEVFHPNNPDKKRGEHYYQLRFFAKITEVRAQTPDPCENKMVDRKFIPAEEFNNYIEWGDVGKDLIKAALEKYDLCEQKT